jgi:hypothetical protein
LQKACQNISRTIEKKNPCKSGEGEIHMLKENILSSEFVISRGKILALPLRRQTRVLPKKEAVAIESETDLVRRLNRQMDMVGKPVVVIVAVLFIIASVAQIGIRLGWWLQ